MSFYTEDISDGYNWRGLERAIARLMNTWDGVILMSLAEQVTREPM